LFSFLILAAYSSKQQTVILEIASVLFELEQVVVGAVDGGICLFG
jgi:hypothetical protein